MEENLLRYIWKNTWSQQIFVLIVVVASMLPYFWALDLPKQIINGPIQGGGFETPASHQTYLHIAYDIPVLGNIQIFKGVELDRLEALLALSFAFLLMVVLNGMFKLYINTYKGRLGERMLRRIRFELVDRVLRFPPWYFSRVKSAEVATMIKDEVEPLGGFTGDAFVQPALLSGQALTALVFIVIQNFWLGMIAVGMVAVQAILIPRMRKRLLELGRERQLTARELSGRVSEIVDGIGAIHGNDTSNLERADIAWRLGRIFSIRYDLYQWKFLVKFLNNFLAQITPFFFYVLGGYFVLQDKLDLGQLVAVIAAYKDLPGPLKELIDWDQARQDTQVKYAQVYQQFNVEPMIDHGIQAIPTQPVTALRSALVVDQLSLTDDSGARLLDRISTEIKPNETVAIVGASGSGAEAFAEALGRLAWPSSGAITIDGQNLLELPESVTGRRISYASGEAFLLHGSLHDNLLYGLKHAPAPTTPSDGASEDGSEWHEVEALKAGNPTFDLRSDWIDYQAAGARGPDDILQAIRPVLDAVSIADDIFDLALRATVDGEANQALSQNIVALRSALRRRLTEEHLDGIVIPFDFDSYNPQAAILENLLFGTVRAPKAAAQRIVEHPHFQEILHETGIGDALYATGLAVAENVIELFHDLPPSHPFFLQLTFMTVDEIPVYQEMLNRLRDLPPGEVSAQDRGQMIRLSFSYIEPRHRFGLLNEDLTRRIVVARKRLRTGMPESLAEMVERYDPERFSASASLMDNIVFGHVAHEVADASDRIRAILKDLISELRLDHDVISIGLGFDVGSGGKRLTTVQRQKLNLARALLRRSDYFIFNRPLSALDRSTQEQIIRRVVQDLHAEGQRPSILWVLSDPRLSRIFDRVLLFHRGGLNASGPYQQLTQESEIFRQLIA
jgi:putative ABC transport system ATP-binding protein